MFQTPDFLNQFLFPSEAHEIGIPLYLHAVTMLEHAYIHVQCTFKRSHFNSFKSVTVMSHVSSLHSV